MLSVCQDISFLASGMSPECCRIVPILAAMVI